jgi:hypothetical protein
MKMEVIRMDKLTKKRFKETVQLWVEMMHFSSKLDNLVEDSDEVGEIYEYDNWFTDPKEEEVSIMGLHVAIENAHDIASTLEESAREMLTDIILSILSHGLSEEFFGQPVSNINENNMEDLFEILLNNFDEIYEYNSEEQYEQFVMCLLSADNELYKSLDME